MNFKYQGGGVPLDGRTPPGLFISDQNCKYWVISSVYRNVVVQLEEFDGRPAFSSVEYGAWDDLELPIRGHWHGEILLKLGKPVEAIFRGTCGVIIESGYNTYLKCNGDDGYGERVVLGNYELPTHVRYSTFYPHWQLDIIRNGALACVFQSESEPPSTICFPAQQKAFSPLHSAHTSP